MAREEEPPRKLKRPLPVALTDEEQKKKGKAAGRLKKSIGKIREEMKAATAGHKEKLKESQAKLDALLDDLDAGTEERNVECEERKDFSKKQVTIVRLDTNEVVERRTMGVEERQESFPGSEVRDVEDGNPDDGEAPAPRRGRKRKGAEDAGNA